MNRCQPLLLDGLPSFFVIYFSPMSFKVRQVNLQYQISKTTIPAPRNSKTPLPAAPLLKTPRLNSGTTLAGAFRLLASGQNRSQPAW